MAFFQTAPALGHGLRDDRVLRGHLAALPEEVRRDVLPALEELGALATGELYRLQLEDRLAEPRHLPFDPWGRRIDRIELTASWRRAAELAASFGLVATPYEKRHGAYARLVQAALIHLFHPSSDVFTCPLAMTDGAAKTLLAHGATALAERALPRLTSRDPKAMWTSGQWMTERTGGSDVGLSEAIARPIGDGRFALHGSKWFTSAATSEMALTLARPEGNGPGGKGLALFYLETRRADGTMNGITLHRLKEKLGTRKLPTAELDLHGAEALPVAGLSDGVKHITPMLAITRTWNALCAVSTMARAIALARAYAGVRHAFGAHLVDKPLHADTLAGMQAEYEAAFALVWESMTLLGREEAGEASADERALLRALTPIVKATTGKQAAAVTSEALECFGGAGYCEDTGLPALLRDGQVFSIWEGTTNVLALDALRAFVKDGSLPILLERVRALATSAGDPALRPAAQAAVQAAERAAAWLAAAAAEPAEAEAGARRLVLTIGRALALAALVAQAQRALARDGDGRPRAAALRFAAHGVDLLGTGAPGAASLAHDRLAAI